MSETKKTAAAKTTAASEKEKTARINDATAEIKKGGAKATAAAAKEVKEAKAAKEAPKAPAKETAKPAKAAAKAPAKEAAKTVKEAPKAPAKEAAKSAKEAPKAAPAKKTTEKKASGKKAPAKKAAAKTAVKAETSIVLQVQGREISFHDFTARAEEIAKAMGKDPAKVSATIYVKPEDGKAYFVIDGEPVDETFDF